MLVRRRPVSGLWRQLPQERVDRRLQMASRRLFFHRIEEVQRLPHQSERHGLRHGRVFSDIHGAQAAAASGRQRSTSSAMASR